MRRVLVAIALSIGVVAPATPVLAAPATSHHFASKWDRIAWCESGGQWHHRPVHNRWGTFSGGLMIMHSVWRHYGGTRYASAPYLATKAQQIIIANRIWADRGSRAWQCK